MPEGTGPSQGVANAFIIACTVFFLFGYACGKISGLEARPTVPVEVRCMTN